MINEIEFNDNNIIKLRVIEIDGYDYKLENENGDLFFVNMDIYGEFKIVKDNYLYMPIDMLEENVSLQFGPICNDRNAIIKVVNEDRESYLQRYYG